MTEIDFIEAKNLKKHFPVQKGFVETLITKQKQYVHAVDDLNFVIHKGETFGLVGESGSGKTTTGRMLVGLIRPTSGDILVNGRSIVKAKTDELQHYRRRAQIIFQDPMAALNPRMTIGQAVQDALDIHDLGQKSERKEQVLQMLDKVGLSPGPTIYDKYPHQLSGGQRQRAVIARAIILKPEFIVADEPVAMVDVSIRAQILDLMLTLKKEMGLTFIFITHDLATANYFCDRIAIMYLGKFAEIGLRDEIFKSPKHPYTVALMSAIPVPDPKHVARRILPRGEIPSPINPPSGCRFHPRCPQVFERCSQEVPQMLTMSATRRVACHLFDKASPPK